MQTHGALMLLTTTTKVGRLRRGTTVRQDPTSRPQLVATKERLWPCMTELMVPDHRYRINEDERMTLRWVDSTNCWIAKSVRYVSYYVWSLLIHSSSSSSSSASASASSSSSVIITRAGCKWGMLRVKVKTLKA